MRWFALLSIMAVFGCRADNPPQPEKAVEPVAKRVPLQDTLELKCKPLVINLRHLAPTSAYPTPDYRLELSSGKQLRSYYMYDDKLLTSLIPVNDGIGFKSHTFRISPSQMPGAGVLAAFDMQVLYEGKILHEGVVYDFESKP